MSPGSAKPEEDRGLGEGRRASVRAPRTRRRWLEDLWADHNRRLLGAAGIVSTLALWEWAGTSGAVKPIFISSPSRVVTAFVQLASEGKLWSNMAVSGNEFFIGFALAVLVGIPLGIVMGWYPSVEAFFDPLVNFLYATPRIALLPLVIIWLGIGLESKVLLVFLSAVLPVLISTMTGVQDVDESVVTAARSFGARDMQIFRTVVLPGSIPNIITGMRLGLGHGLIAVVVAEFYAATAGVGFLINEAANSFQTDVVFAGVVVTAGAGVILTAVFRRIERRFQSWKPQRGR